MTTAHIDLRFVGHAEATNRLLNVDPFWEWEPMAPDANGLPQYDGNRGMWIRLTVCGMTRLGYGSADGKTGGDAVKEIIGDAIRNAGMRFGMALDLWTSGELEIIESGTGPSDEETGSTSNGQPGKSEAASTGQSAAVAPADGTQHVDRLKGQATRCWSNAVALSQVLKDAEKNEVADVEFDTQEGRQTLRALLTNRISVLNQNTTNGGERNVA